VLKCIKENVRTIRRKYFDYQLKLEVQCLPVRLLVNLQIVNFP